MSTPKLVLSLLSDDQEFQVLQASEAGVAARRAGVEIETVFAKNNAILQREQIYRHIGGLHKPRPAAIVLQALAGDGLPKVAEDAAKAGVGWILLNRDVAYIDILRAEYPKLPIGVVTVNQAEIGRIQGQQLRRLLPAGGKVLCIEGPAGSSAAMQRLQGLQEVIASARIELKVLTADWTEAGGEKAVTSWLRLSTSRDFALGAVAAQNDAMAIGARKAIAAFNPEWLGRPFIGCDGMVSGGQRLVRERVLAATVVLQPTAGVAVDLAGAHFRSGTPLPARTVLEPKSHPASS